MAEGLPADARARLSELETAAGGLFTSDLSVNEFILVRQPGFRPRGLVLGSSIYRIGITGRLGVANREARPGPP
ncbi:MAG TPA: hypothetical protein VE990_04065 [Acidimicrobiales bacterium]|nr:hypothetical protein [Acidimicrobiales bacterium]